jgi:hypothetical protein
MQRLSNYGGYVIATSVSTSAGKPFEASFVVSRHAQGADAQPVHHERLGRTFAFDEEARAAATQAAQAYVDRLIGKGG